MKSYNCFYSAIFEALEPYFHESTNLLIDNRWQFFYHPSDHYSDDRRLVGEFPFPFDNDHLRMLFDMYQIKIEIVPAQKGVYELADYIKKNGFAIIFANKYILNGLYKKSENKRCVTTIRLNEWKQEEVGYTVYDHNLPNIKINQLALESAWKSASEYSFLNQQIVKISLTESESSQDYAKQFFWNSFISSIKKYLKGADMDGIISGQQGLICFAESVAHWKKESIQKSIDCAMYIEFIIRQRELLNSNLVSLQPNAWLCDSVEWIQTIIGAWKKVKMFLFILGKREQYESLKFVSNQIKIIAREEYLCLKDLVEKAESIYL